MQRFRSSPLYLGVIQPILQILAFILGTGLVLSLLMIILAFLARGTAVDQHGS